VKLDGTWHFLDTTWGAGHVDGTRFVPDHTAAWFDMDPRLFVLNHYPRDARWLLLEHPTTLAEYERAPFVETDTLETLLEAGFTTGDCISFVAFAPLPEFFGRHALAFKSMGGQSADLEGYLSQGAVPQAHAYPSIQPRLVEYPRQGRLTAGTRYRFAFRLSGCEQAAVIAGGSFTFLAKDGDLFSGAAVAAAGSVLLSAKIDHNGSVSFRPLMIWQAR
jgi:hypothetical protein